MFDKVSDFVYRGLQPKTCRSMTQHNPTLGRGLQRVGSSFLRMRKMSEVLFVAGCVSDMEATVPLRVQRKVWAAAGLPAKLTCHDYPSLFSGRLSLLDFWQSRHLTRGVLHEHRGCEVEKFFTVSRCFGALAQGRPNLASGCTFSRRPSTSATFSDSADFSGFPKSARVARTRQAEQSGSREPARSF